MKGLIGRKLGMTQVFGPEGEAIPVTVLEVVSNKILQVKTTDRDGYEAIQVGYGQKKLHRATKANRTRAEAAGLDSAPLRIREFRTTDASLFKVGDEIAIDFFRTDRAVRHGRDLPLEPPYEPQHPSGGSTDTLEQNAHALATSPSAGSS